MASPTSLVTPGNKGNNPRVKGKLVAEQEVALHLMLGFHKHGLGLMIEQISNHQEALLTYPLEVGYRPVVREIAGEMQ